MGNKFGRRRAGSSNEMLKSRVCYVFQWFGTKEALTVFAKKIRWAVVKEGTPRAKETKRWVVIQE